MIIQSPFFSAGRSVGQRAARNLRRGVRGRGKAIVRLFEYRTWTRIDSWSLMGITRPISPVAPLDLWHTQSFSRLFGTNFVSAWGSRSTAAASLFGLWLADFVKAFLIFANVAGDVRETRFPWNVFRVFDAVSVYLRELRIRIDFFSLTECCIAHARAVYTTRYEVDIIDFKYVKIGDWQ